MLLSLLLSAFIALSDVVLLYPQGQDSAAGCPVESNGLTGPETMTDHGYIRNIGDSARLEIYLPRRCNGLMVVNCPGGGYWENSSFNEGSRAAEWFVSQGVAVCNLIYRLPNGHHIVPLTDVRNAFRYCRSHAQEWGVSRIGVVGYSAGGHLAASAATMFTDTLTRPDFAVLLYPVITMEDGLTDQGTMKRLTCCDPDLRELYSIENRVGPQTPPTILFHSLDDRLVPVENSRRYHAAMLAAGADSQLHEFPSGGHGWGFTTMENAGRDALSQPQRQQFFQLLSSWLQRQMSD